MLPSGPTSSSPIADGEHARRRHRASLTAFAAGAAALLPREAFPVAVEGREERREGPILDVDGLIVSGNKTIYTNDGFENSYTAFEE